MFTAKFIKNIFLEPEGLRAIGRSGKMTRVFAKQGDLDGSCSIYSLMMMLIFHQKLDWEDLIDGERAKENEFVDKIQSHFLYGLNGLCLGGDVMEELSNDSNSFFGKKLLEVLFCLDPGRPLSSVQVWNNVIGIDYLSCNDDAISDINYFTEKEVCVAKILIMNDNPPEFDCPF